MKKFVIVAVTVSLAALFGGTGNTSEYEKKGRREYYEHGEKYEDSFYGTVQRLPEGLIGTWVVDGKEVQVGKETYIEREHGKLGVGSYVEVEGRYTANTFIARKIEAKRKSK